MYTTIFIKNIKQQLMYRSEFFLNILGSLLYVYVQICIWQALLPSDTNSSSVVSINQMVTFIIVSYLLRQASRTYFTSAFDSKVKNGDIALDLIKPISMKNMMISEQLSENVCIILFSCIPVAIVSGFLWGIEFSVGIEYLLIFVVSAVLAIALRFYIEYISGLCVFWIRDSVNMRQLLSGLILIFSGSTIPLWFYPNWLNAIGRFLPFRLMSFEPIQIFMGRVVISSAIEIVLYQMFWLLLLYILERFVWSRIKNNIFVQGG